MRGLMNNEYKLYKLIQDNENFSGTDVEVGKLIGRSPASVTKYRYKLKEDGYIDYTVAFKDNVKRTFYRLTDKVYTGNVEW